MTYSMDGNPRSRKISGSLSAPDVKRRLGITEDKVQDWVMLRDDVRTISHTLKSHLLTRHGVLPQWRHVDDDLLYNAREELVRRETGREYTWVLRSDPQIANWLFRTAYVNTRETEAKRRKKRRSIEAGRMGSMSPLQGPGTTASSMSPLPNHYSQSYPTSPVMPRVSYEEPERYWNSEDRSRCEDARATSAETPRRNDWWSVIV